MRKKKINNVFFFLLFFVILYSINIGLTFRYRSLETKLLNLVQEINKKELEIFSMEFDLQNQVSLYKTKDLFFQKIVPKVIFE